MARYRIVEWDERYEVDDHGGVWTPGDNKRAGPLLYIREKVHGKSQGLGWRKLLKEAGQRRAPGVFGIFAKLKEIAGDTTCENRGFFQDDTECPLSFILGLDDRDIKFAISVLCTIGWVRLADPDSRKSPESPESPEIPGIPNQFSSVQSTPPPIVPPPGGACVGDALFDRFWSAYPKKVAEDAARKAFAKRNPDEGLLAKMLAAIEAQKRTDDWKRERGRYIPHPNTWLDAGRWRDVVGPVKITPPKPTGPSRQQIEDRENFRRWVMDQTTEKLVKARAQITAKKADWMTEVHGRIIDGILAGRKTP